MMIMHYGAIKNLDIANGPGCRVSLFVSGCRNKCPGCFQSETWDFTYGQPFKQATMDYILQLLSDPHISGLSILGGDPFELENVETVRNICKLVKIKCPSKSIWVWTGYMYESVKGLDVMDYIDVLVDGPFVEAQKDMGLAFRGSSNQRVIDVQKSLVSGCVVRYPYEKHDGRTLFPEARCNKHT